MHHKSFLAILVIFLIFLTLGSQQTGMSRTLLHSSLLLFPLLLILASEHIGQIHPGGTGLPITNTPGVVIRVFALIVSIVWTVFFLTSG
jgi:hypothetical protein